MIAIKKKNIKAFPKGGVHPPDCKLSAHNPIEKLGLPKTIFVPLAQHIGVPAVPVIKPFEVVNVGQLIAKAQGFVSANIHSPVSGKVRKIDNIVDISGYKKPAIIIDVDQDIWEEGIDLSPELKTEIPFSPEEIIQKISAAGIVGMGGAAFPTHVKLSVPQGKKAEFLLINGAECEPYLTADHRLMLEKGEQILVGVQILMKALNVERALFGIENNKPDAIAHLSELAKNYKGIEVYPLKMNYPQGAEKQLIEALTKQQVPSGGLPIDVGCIVQNVGTVFAVYEAVQKNKPLVERVVTVSGPSVQRPSNFLVRLGTPFSFVIDAAGGMPDDTGKIISGGPMMGRAVSHPEVPVTKGTSGILLLPTSQSKRRKVLECIRCAKCVSVCPLGLEPYFLMTLTQKNLLDLLEKEKALDCCECGSCSFICPSNRPLLDFIRLGKSILIQKKKEQAKK